MARHSRRSASLLALLATPAFGGQWRFAEFDHVKELPGEEVPNQPELTGKTAEECKALCMASELCTCTVYTKMDGRCQQRNNCREHEVRYSGLGPGDLAPSERSLERHHRVYVKIPRSGIEYTIYHNENSYNGYGSIDLDGDRRFVAKSERACMDACTVAKECDCAVFLDRVEFDLAPGTCWLRTGCEDPQKFKAAPAQYLQGFKVMVKSKSLLRGAKPAVASAHPREVNVDGTSGDLQVVPKEALKKRAEEAALKKKEEEEAAKKKRLEIEEERKRQQEEEAAKRKARLEAEEEEQAAKKKRLESEEAARKKERLEAEAAKQKKLENKEAAEKKLFAKAKELNDAEEEKQGVPVWVYLLGAAAVAGGILLAIVAGSKSSARAICRGEEVDDEASKEPMLVARVVDDDKLKQEEDEKRKAEEEVAKLKKQQEEEEEEKRKAEEEEARRKAEEEEAKRKAEEEEAARKAQEEEDKKKKPSAKKKAAAKAKEAPKVKEREALFVLASEDGEELTLHVKHKPLGFVLSAQTHKVIRITDENSDAVQQGVKLGMLLKKIGCPEKPDEMEDIYDAEDRAEINHKLNELMKALPNLQKDEKKEEAA
eukprot:TRINITY_DN3278_c0_g1_i2.p1 TRINITY_DN3278_c0_g1~~TRINITY_DN3278_c0_g1_i2.p1  ORF type:complete len:612 (-),score=225.04 TRINITY_DN3278_c0_g1_i2:308-2107(-)